MITPARPRQDPVAPAPRLRMRSSSTCRARINDMNLAFLDASDTIVEIVTYDSTTIHNTIAMADTFRAIGYPATKVQLPGQPRRQRRWHRCRRPRSAPSVASRSTRVVSDGSSSSGRTTRACRSSWPTPARRSARTSANVAGELLGAGRVARRGRAAARVAERVRSRAHRGLRLRGRRPDGPARDPPPDARTNRRSTSATTRARRTASRPDDEVLAFSTQALDALAERDVKAIVVACNTSTAVGDRRAPAALRPADPGRDPAGRPGGRAGDPQPAGRASSPRRRRSARTPTSHRSRTRTRRSRSTSTRRRPSCPMVEAGVLTGPRPRRPSPRPWRRCWASATRPANPSSRGRPGATIDTLLLGCTHYPLLRPLIAAAAGTASRSSIRRRRPRRRWPNCSRQRPRGARDDARRPPPTPALRGHERPDELATPPRISS